MHHRAARAATVAGVSIFCGWLLYLALCDFLVGALADEQVRMAEDATAASFITAPFKDDRVGLNADTLAAVARFFPNSPRLHTRLAGIRSYKAHEDLSVAEYHARRAIRLSPHDYRPRLQLAYIQEFTQNLPAAEQATREALRLAPGYMELHWLLGSLLAERKNFSESLQEFRTAATGDGAYLQPVLNRVWKDWAGNAEAVRAVTPDDPKDRRAVALFLLEHSRPLESAAMFRQIDREALLRDRDTGAYLNNLIRAGHVGLARDLWRTLMHSAQTPEEHPNYIWNGGFESDILVDFAQFDWSIQPSDYARVSIDNTTAHTGKRSLRLDFNGRETTRLEDEIQQLTVVHPGTRYRLQYYVKTEHLAAPEGPRVAVSDTISKQWTAASSPASIGSRDWELRTLEFAAPSSTVIVAVKQRPRFSYEDPTHGTVWFDDFEIREVSR